MAFMRAISQSIRSQLDDYRQHAPRELYRDFPTHGLLSAASRDEHGDKKSGDVAAPVKPVLEIDPAILNSIDGQELRAIIKVSV